MAFEFGSGAAMWAGNVFDLRQKLKLSSNLGVEVSVRALAGCISTLDSLVR